MPFNPFSKTIHDLAPEDLEALVVDQVAEGYWIEYKSQLQSTTSIAKSISSFANSYGGWYLAGVLADKLTNAASQIVGLDLSEHKDPISTVRDSIRSGIDPVPVFEARMLSIAPERAVVVVFVPGDQETPFVAKDGRIYRRLGDSSDPVPITDRHTLDRLHDTGRRSRELFDAFCVDPRTFSEAEQGAWAKVFLQPTLTSSRPLAADRFTEESLETLRRFITRRVSVVFDDKHTYFQASVPVDTLQLSSASMLLSASAGVSVNSLELEMFFDGRLRCFIPLQYPAIMSPQGPVNVKSRVSQRTLERLASTDEGFFSLRFFDIRELWFTLGIVATVYEAWLFEFVAPARESLAGYRWRIHLDDIWRHVAFVDHDAWGSHVQSYGIPVQKRNELELPDSPARGELLTRDAGPLWALLASRISVAFGFTTNLLHAVAFPKA